MTWLSKRKKEEAEWLYCKSIQTFTHISVNCKHKICLCTKIKKKISSNENWTTYLKLICFTFIKWNTWGPVKPRTLTFPLVSVPKFYPFALVNFKIYCILFILKCYANSKTGKLLQIFEISVLAKWSEKTSGFKIIHPCNFWS